MTMNYQDRNVQIAADYVGGMRSPALGVKYGMTRERVRQILRPLNLIGLRKKQDVARREVALSAAQSRRDALIKRKELAVVAFLAGASIRQAAKSNKVSATAVSKILKARGIQNTHSRWRDFTKIKTRTDELLLAGFNPPRIAQILKSEGEKISIYWIYDNFADTLKARKAANNNKQIEAIAA